MPGSKTGRGSEPGPETVRYPNGGVKMTGAHLAGEMHGPWAWYRTDGTVMRTGEFDRGKQVGVWRTLDRSGRVVKETDFTKRRGAVRAHAQRGLTAVISGCTAGGPSPPERE
jgi:antitoxin component YwqK of YwqJK toxin-antitoxin module